MVAKELGGCSLSDVSVRLPTSGVILFVDVRIRLGGHGGHRVGACEVGPAVLGAKIPDI